MIEYIKFWLSAVIAELFVLVILFGVICSIWFGLCVYHWLKKAREK
jgi:Na+/H+-dicarboxylate symporter